MKKVQLFHNTNWVWKYYCSTETSLSRKGAQRRHERSWEIGLVPQFYQQGYKDGGSDPAWGPLLGFPVPGRWLILLITDIETLLAIL